MSIVTSLQSYVHPKSKQLHQHHGRSWSNVMCAYDHHLIRVPSAILDASGEVKPEYLHSTLNNQVYISPTGNCYCSIDEFARIAFEE